MKTKLTLFVTVLAAALFGMGCASTEPAFVSDGLVAYYPFDGNAKDESGNGNDGKVEGALLVSDRGELGNRYYFFDGRGCIRIPDNKSLRPKHITLSAFVMTHKLGVNSPILGKAERTDGSVFPKGEQYQLYLNTSLRPQFEIKRNSGGRPAIGWQTVYAPLNAVLKEGYWHMLTATWDGQVMVMYLNGEKISENPNAIKGEIDDVSGGELLIGSGWNAKGDTFRGHIDDVRIYNRALSAEEVKALYNLEKPKTK